MFQNGAKPIEVACIVDEPEGLEVDEHSITIARYASGLSKYETQWGTFTNCWQAQPQPKCGYVIKGTHDTLSRYDKEPFAALQTRENLAGVQIPVDTIEAPFS